MFKIGQDVIALRNTGSSGVKKGRTYTVLAVGGCCYPCIDVGIYGHQCHCICGSEYPGDTWWHRNEIFAPLESTYATETLKDIRILQLEDEILELRELKKLEPLKQE